MEDINTKQYSDDEEGTCGTANIQTVGKQNTKQKLEKL